MKNAQMPRKPAGLKLYVLLHSWDTNMGQGCTCVGVFTAKKLARRFLRKGYQKIKQELLAKGFDIPWEENYYGNDRAVIEAGNNLYNWGIFEKKLVSGKVRRVKKDGTQRKPLEPMDTVKE